MPKTAKSKMLQASFIEPDHGQYWKVQVMKALFMPASTGLSSIQYLIWNSKILNVLNIHRYVSMAVILEPLMWHVN
jgi:hypothetical protein